MKTCKKEKCDFCNKTVNCDWWHNVTQHNMPLNWVGDKPEEILNHIKHHLGYLTDSIEIKLKK